MVALRKTKAEDVVGGALLVKVLRLHRYLALGFGLVMTLRPDRAIAIDPWRPLADPERGITPSEALTMRMWGCFVVVVAYIVHVAASTPHAGFRRAVGRALCACFGAAGVIVAGAVVRPDPSWGREERAGQVILTAIFGVISMAYGAGLVSP
jgi:hypothetical protein